MFRVHQTVSDRLDRTESSLPDDPDSGGTHLVYGIAVIEQVDFPLPVTLLSPLDAECKVGWHVLKEDVGASDFSQAVSCCSACDRCVL